MDKHTEILFFTTVAIIIIMSIIFLIIPNMREKEYEDNKTCIEFLEKHDWKTQKFFREKVYVTIPSDWNAVHENYNEIQINQNFDLTPYKGKRALRYTYVIKNYPTREKGVFANILMYQGKIIGGDVMNYKLDGFMHGFDLPK